MKNDKDLNIRDIELKGEEDLTVNDFVRLKEILEKEYGLKPVDQLNIIEATPVPIKAVVLQPRTSKVRLQRSNKDNIYDFLKYNGKRVGRLESAQSFGFGTLTYEGQPLKGGVNRTVTILDATRKDIIKDVNDEYYGNKAEVLVFIDVLPILDNPELITFLFENKVSFTSLKNSGITETFSETLINISNNTERKLGGNRIVGKMNQRKANKFAKKIGPILDDLEMKGYSTLDSKAEYLNSNDIKTSRNKLWTRNAIKKTWERWQKLKEEQEKKQSSKTPKPE